MQMRFMNESNLRLNENSRDKLVNFKYLFFASHRCYEKVFLSLSNLASFIQLNETI